jgi:selenocysteine lyase/cysteine desulfurase
MNSQNRRNFLKSTGLMMSGWSLTGLLEPLALSHIDQILQEADQRVPEDIASDEAFWQGIREAYTINPGLLNLNSGGVSPSTEMVQNAVDRYNRMSNEGPSYYMWRILDQGREPLRENLAKLAGCSKDEIAINRNATEAINTIIFGLKLEKGDEVVVSKMDYPNMIHAWKQREKRDGIKLVWVEIPIPCNEADELVTIFTKAFTSKTKVVHLTHVINWNGQVLPVRKIADEAKKRNIQVLVDGAHSFAQMDYTIADLNCDFFGTSLHKWMCGPLGSGMMYIRKEKIAEIWPLLSAEKPESEDIRKFENLGTRSFPIEQAIHVALDFHNRIGTARKRARLMYLRNYWVNQAKEISGVKIFSPSNLELSCALAGVLVEGKTPQALEGFLLDKHKIHTVAIEWESLKCVRVTPNVFTLTADLDRLVKGIQAFAAQP